MSMILEYDQSPQATADQKVSTLKDSVQRALDDVETQVSNNKGVAGVGIDRIVEMWYLSSSELEPINGEWVYEQPKWSRGKYLWTRNEVHYTDGNIKYTTPALADALNKAYLASSDASDTLDEITVKVSTVEQQITDINGLATEAKSLAESASASAQSAVSQMDTVNGELDALEGTVDTVRGDLETLSTEMSANYATKGELTSAQTTLNASIEANAAGLSTAVGRIDQVEIDSSQAIADAEAAQTAANNARSVADEATAKYNTLKTQADATDEQLAQAKLDVQTAQAAAEAAQDAADTAQAAANSLGDRVTTTETNISQNATNISSVATRVTTIEDNYIDSSEIASLTSTFNQTAEEITLGIVAGYTSKDELNTYKHEVENMFSANEQGFEFNFNRLEQQLNEVGGEVNAQKEYIRLINGEIHIGKDGNPVTSVYTNNALEFRYNGVTVAKFTNETLEVRNITSENQIAFFGDWAIRKGAEVSGKGYNLNDIWIGG